MYTGAAGSAALASVGWLQAFNEIMDSETTLLSSLPLFGLDFWVLVMSILFLTGILVSLYFMWDVRHPKTE